MSKANSPNRIATCFGNTLHAKRVRKGLYKLVCNHRVYGFIQHRARDWYGEVHGRGLFANACADSMLEALIQLDAFSAKLEKLTGDAAEHEISSSRSWIANLQKLIENEFNAEA